MENNSVISSKKMQQIQGNIQSILTQGGEQSDIDQYLRLEGVTKEQVFPQQQKVGMEGALPEAASQAARLAATPFIPAPLNGAPQTLTGDISSSPIGQQLGQGYIQGSTLGYGLPMAAKAGATIQEPTSFGESAANLAGNVIGGTGLAATASMLPILIPKIGATQATTLIGKAAWGAAKGAIAGYAWNPSSKEIVPVDSNDRITGMAIAGVAGGAFPLLSAAANKMARFNQGVKLMKSDVKKMKLLEEIGNQLDDSMDAMYVKYGDGIAQAQASRPLTRVDITDEIIDLARQSSSGSLDNSVKSAINSSKKNLLPLVRQVQEELASGTQPYIEVTASKAQKIINDISVVSKAYQRGGSTVANRPVKALRGRIAGRMVDAFPEMADVRAEYGAFKEAWKEVSKAHRSASFEVLANQEFKGAKARGAVKEVLGEELAEELFKMRDARKAMDFASKMIDRILFAGAVSGALGIGGYLGAKHSRGGN